MDSNNIKTTFFGVYLLKSKNTKYNDLVYIGFTVNPEKRIKQHNQGKDFGGAWKTSGKGPWDMILLVHGFPNEIAALRFEWSWQHPKKSRMLRLQPNKKLYGKETEFEYRLRIMNQMLFVGPWCRLPLKINILSSEYSFKIRETIKFLPNHMLIEDGAILKNLNDIGEKQSTFTASDQDQTKCNICEKLFNINSPILVCNYCKMTAHLICLAKHMLENCEHVIPINGSCPICFKILNYGELINNNLFLFN